jgi:nucleotide-binding universal stress UspA family protein
MENSFLRASPADPHAHKAAVVRTLHEQLTAGGAALEGHAVVETSDNPADAIAGYATAANIDLIVIGTNGRSGVAQLLVGSVAERIVRTARCPVLTVKHPEHEFVVPDEAPQSTAQLS